MSMMNYPYAGEDKIVWMKDRESLAKMKFVRQRFLFCGIRTGPMKPPEGEMLIGYATLKKSVPGIDERGFCRRIFTLKPDDWCDSSGSAAKQPLPEEAVDPLSVQAGKPGQMIWRSNRVSRYCGMATEMMS